MLFAFTGVENVCEVGQFTLPRREPCRTCCRTKIFCSFIAGRAAEERAVQTPESRGAGQQRRGARARRAAAAQRRAQLEDVRGHTRHRPAAQGERCRRCLSFVSRVQLVPIARGSQVLTEPRIRFMFLELLTEQTCAFVCHKCSSDSKVWQIQRNLVVLRAYVCLFCRP